MNPIHRTPYLYPYLKAARQYGAGFDSLLWASPATQEARFAAIERLGQLNGKSVLDVGCGRADLLDFLKQRDIQPADYIGIEAVPALAEAAEAKTASLHNASILRADFVRDPQRLFVGADVLVFSGSFNTVEDEDFYPLLRRAFHAAAESVVFNFLCSASLAGADYLRWRSTDDVLRFLGRVDGVDELRMIDDYLPGDCTVGVFHERV